MYIYMQIFVWDNKCASCITLRRRSGAFDKPIQEQYVLYINTKSINYFQEYQRIDDSHVIDYYGFIFEFCLKYTLDFFSISDPHRHGISSSWQDDAAKLDRLQKRLLKDVEDENWTGVSWLDSAWKGEHQQFPLDLLDLLVWYMMNNHVSWHSSWLRGTSSNAFFFIGAMCPETEFCWYQVRRVLEPKSL